MIIQQDLRKFRYPCLEFCPFKALLPLSPASGGCVSPIQQTDRIIGTIWKIVGQNSLYRILLDCGQKYSYKKLMITIVLYRILLDCGQKYSYKKLMITIVLYRILLDCGHLADGLAGLPILSLCRILLDCGPFVTQSNRMCYKYKAQSNRRLLFLTPRLHGGWVKVCSLSCVHLIVESTINTKTAI